MMIIQPGKLYKSKTDEKRYAYVNYIEQQGDEATIFGYTTEKDVKCRALENDFWAAYHKDDVEADKGNNLLARLRKTTESTKEEFDCLKKENKELKEKLEKIKEELEQKKSILDYSDKYILDLEELRKNNSDQIESYKKDLLHVVRSLREGS